MFEHPAKTPSFGANDVTPWYPYSPEGMKICKRSHHYERTLLQCPFCQKEQHEHYIQTHKEKMRTYYMEYDKARAERRRLERDNDQWRTQSSRNKKARYWRCPEKILKQQKVYNRKNPERPVWKGMIRRCTDPTCKGYKNYGGRGITVCDRWLSYENFIADMGKRPSARHSIERRNNSKGYDPDNCYWATRAEQNRNTRRSRFFEFNGKRQCMQDWAAELGITASLLWSRLHVLGWPLERALTTGPCDRYD